MNAFDLQPDPGVAWLDPLAFRHLRHETDGMVGWRGRLTSQEAVEKARIGCAKAPWAWMFAGRTVTTRTWSAWIIHLAADNSPSGPWIHVDARTGAVRRVEYTSPAVRWRRIAAGCLLVVMVILIVAVFFPGRVCDQQVVSSGKVVFVCRHLEATDPPVIAIGIFILATLGVFYSEISGFGISLKRRVDEVDQTARTGLQLAEQTRTENRRLDETTRDLATYNLDNLKVRGQAGVTPGPEDSGKALSAAEQQVHHLAVRYNTLRGTMPSSLHRTELMADIVQKMGNALMEVSDFDVAGYLDSNDRGLRLAGYAYLLDHVEPQYRPKLVELADEEDKPFGQYTALRALEKQGEAAERLGDDSLAALSSLAQRLGPDEERTRLINRIIAVERSKGYGS